MESVRVRPAPGAQGREDSDSRGSPDRSEDSEEQGVRAVTLLEQNLPENEALASRDVKRVGEPVQPAQRTPLGKLLDLEGGSVVHCDCGDPADVAHLRCRRLRVGPDRCERPYGRG